MSPARSPNSHHSTLILPRGQLIGPTTHAECDEFLNSYKPSVADTTYGPWYWCQIGAKAKDGASKPAEDLDEDDSTRVKFEEKGKQLVDDLVAQCKHIKVRRRGWSDVLVPAQLHNWCGHYN